MTQPIQIIINEHALLLATLVVQVAIVAMVASLLLRFRRFTRLILAPQPSLRDRVEFGIILGIISAASAWSRVRLGYTGADLAVVVPLLTGLVMGWNAGLVAGLIGGIIPFAHGEWLSLPMQTALGASAGLARRLFAEPTALWMFSPVPFGDTLQSWRRWRKEGVLDPRLLVLVVGTFSEVSRTEVARFAGHGWLFSYAPHDPVSYYLVILACLTCVGVSLRIWNTPRIDAHIRRQEALLAEARFDALRSQINPHFLFNTLNTIVALVRTEPEQARAIILKLSTILRHLLYSRADVSTLKAELDLVDDYLGIEQMRFGKDRLQVAHEVAPEALEAQVPTMLLQPLVENAIKHGIAPKESGGTITIRARVAGLVLDLAVEDNGAGMSPAAAEDSLRRGIGLSNVRERLASLYGDDFSMDLHSAPGAGTLVRIRIPLLYGGGPQDEFGEGGASPYIHDQDGRRSTGREASP